MSTESKLFQHWASFCVALSLEEAGVLDYIRTHNVSTCEEISQELALDQSLLVDLVHFVARVSPEILRTNDEGCVYGGFLLETKLLTNYLNFALAYREELHNTASVLEGRVEKTESSSQHGLFLGRSSSIYSEKFYRHIISALDGNQSRQNIFIDLGCGSGELLLRVQQEINTPRLFGVDRHVSATHISAHKNITYVAADLHDIESWSSEIFHAIPAPDVKNAHVTLSLVTVLHEFTKSDEEFSNFISKLKMAFPDASLLVAEQLFFSEKDVKSLPFDLQHAVGFYQLIHSITGQGMPKTLQEWQRWFENEGVEVRKITLTDQVSALFSCVL